MSEVMANKEEPVIKNKKISFVELVVYNGDQYMLKDATRNGEDINIRDGAGKLPIEVAIENNFVEVVNILIENAKKEQTKENTS